MDTRIADDITQFREMIDRALSRVNTCVPGQIESFDDSTQTVSVVPAIRMKVQQDGVTSFLDFPLVINAPVIYPFATTAGFALTLPIRKGDPCIILFSQRSIDNWVQYGGVQNPEEGIGCRHHDLTDALVLMAAPPSPLVLSAWEAEGIELRNRARITRLTVKDDVVEAYAGTTSLTLNTDGTITAVAPVTATINTPLTIMTGNLHVNGGISCFGTYGSTGGKITTPGDIESTAGDIIDQVRSMEADRNIYNGHTHNENGDGGGTTDSPNQQE